MDLYKSLPDSKPKSQPESRNPSKRQKNSTCQIDWIELFRKSILVFSWIWVLKPGIKTSQEAARPSSPGPQVPTMRDARLTRIGSNQTKLSSLQSPAVDPWPRPGYTNLGKTNHSEGREFLKKPPEIHHLKRQVGEIHFDCLVMLMYLSSF